MIWSRLNFMEHLPLIDTHFHWKHLKARGLVLTDQVPLWKNSGIVGVVDVGLSVEGTEERIREGQALQRLGIDTWLSLGWYPSHSRGLEQADLKKMEKTFRGVMDSGFFTLVGECGMDQNPEYGSPREQKALFALQAHLAKEYDVPLVVHNRGCTDDVVETLVEIQPKKVILHCFSEGPEWIGPCADQGWYASFAGNMTHRANMHLRQALHGYPKDLTLIETDSPYLRPEGVISSPNTPGNLHHCFSTLSQVWDMEPSRCSQILINNSRRLLGQAPLLHSTSA